MKHLITITFTFLLIFGLSAQTDQGSMLIGAEGGFNMTTVSDLGETFDGDKPYDDYEIPTTTTTTTVAKLRFGYFVIDNLAVGAILDYTSSKTDLGADGDDWDLDNPDPQSMTSYGAFARYYIAGVAFVGASYQMKTESVWDDIEDEYDDMGLEWNKPRVSIMGAEAGFSLFLSDNVAFTPTVSYTILTVAQDGEMWDPDDGEVKEGVARNMTGYLNIGAGFNIHF